VRPDRRSLRDFLADWGHWAGYSADPAETSGPTLWLIVGKFELYWTWRTQ
jgi:hypothetical protein